MPKPRNLPGKRMPVCTPDSSYDGSSSIDSSEVNYSFSPQKRKSTASRKQRRKRSKKTSKDAFDSEEDLEPIPYRLGSDVKKETAEIHVCVVPGTEHEKTAVPVVVKDERGRSFSLIPTKPSDPENFCCECSRRSKCVMCNCVKAKRKCTHCRSEGCKNGDPRKKPSETQVLPVSPAPKPTVPKSVNPGISNSDENTYHSGPIKVISSTVLGPVLERRIGPEHQSASRCCICAGRRTCKDCECVRAKRNCTDCRCFICSNQRPFNPLPELEEYLGRNKTDLKSHNPFDCLAVNKKAKETPVWANPSPQVIGGIVLDDVTEPSVDHPYMSPVKQNRRPCESKDRELGAKDSNPLILEITQENSRDSTLDTYTTGHEHVEDCVLVGAKDSSVEDLRGYEPIISCKKLTKGSNACPTSKDNKTSQVTCGVAGVDLVSIKNTVLKDTCCRAYVMSPDRLLKAVEKAIVDTVDVEDSVSQPGKNLEVKQCFVSKEGIISPEDSVLLSGNVSNSKLQQSSLTRKGDESKKIGPQVHISSPNLTKTIKYGAKEESISDNDCLVLSDDCENSGSDTLLTIDGTTRDEEYSRVTVMNPKGRLQTVEIVKACPGVELEDDVKVFDRFMHSNDDHSYVTPNSDKKILGKSGKKKQSSSTKIHEVRSDKLATAKSPLQELVKSTQWQKFVTDSKSLQNMLVKDTSQSGHGANVKSEETAGNASRVMSVSPKKRKRQKPGQSRDGSDSSNDKGYYIVSSELKNVKGCLLWDGEGFVQFVKMGSGNGGQKTRTPASVKRSCHVKYSESSSPSSSEFESDNDTSGDDSWGSPDKEYLEECRSNSWGPSGNDCFDLNGLKQNEGSLLPSKDPSLQVVRGKVPQHWSANSRKVRDRLKESESTSQDHVPVEKLLPRKCERTSCYGCGNIDQGNQSECGQFMENVCHNAQQTYCRHQNRAEKSLDSGSRLCEQTCGCHCARMVASRKDCILNCADRGRDGKIHDTRPSPKKRKRRCKYGQHKKYDRVVDGWLMTFCMKCSKSTKVSRVKTLK